MENLQYITSQDIKFDRNNIYFRTDKNIYERLNQSLSAEQAGMYLVFIMSLETALEEGYLIDRNKPVGFFDIEQIEKIYSQIDVRGILEQIISKGYMKEIIIDGFKGYLFLY